ncbi:DUF2461 domain-containing protein [Roseiconus nitratireducens]|uniref:DUF2461 domain-containing protein n=1 Tax=Roseiconus nitratireducens TaxID=2605748 RepID=A0A5M6D5E2_9BACT|nr:DUF2461 domain-containing protein [Roseiconus nitratireducens]KAA5542728.1 DUF2461 domain-containing protein [Roseiconus nitratireducens]
MSEPVLTESLFDFLEQLRRHNDRDWFNEHKSDFQRDVRDPAVRLIQRLEKPLAKSAPMLLVDPRPHNGSLMRIYRDTRFSKNKDPYKTNVGISLRHQAGKDIHAPGVYLHFDPDQCFIGAGCWHPEGRVLADIRRAIDQQPKDWLKARDHKAFREHFTLVGESLKTSPRDYPKDHAMIEDLRRKDFIATAPLTRQQATGDDLPALILDRIKRARPLMRFLCDAIGVPY